MSAKKTVDNTNNIKSQPNIEKTVNSKDDLKNLSVVGNRLKELRMQNRVALDDVAQHTKIRLSYLQAIEDGNYNILPEKTYVLGYIKRYASFLNMVDIDELLTDIDFKVINKDDNGSTKLDLTTNSSISDFMRRNLSIKLWFPSFKLRKFFIILIIILAVLALLSMSTMFFEPDNKTNDSSSEVLAKEMQIKDSDIKDSDQFVDVEKEDIVVEDSKEELDNDNQLMQNKENDNQDQVVQEMKEQNQDEVINIEDEKKEAPAKKEENAKPKRLILSKWPADEVDRNAVMKFNGDVWVRFFKTGNREEVYLDKIFTKDDTYNIPNVAGISMVVGDYTKINIELDGDPLKITSSKRTSVLSIDLNPDSLRRQFTQ